MQQMAVSCRWRQSRGRNPFVACTREVLYGLSNLLYMLQVKGTSFSSRPHSRFSEYVSADTLNNGILLYNGTAWEQLDGGCGYRNMRTWRTLGEKSCGGCVVLAERK